MRLALLVRPLQLLARALTLVVFTGARGLGRLAGRCVSAASRLAAAPDGGAAAAASLPVAMRWLSFFTHPVFGTPLAAVAVSWLARSARRSLAQSWRAQPAVSPQGKGGTLGHRIRVTLARVQPERTARGWRTELAAGSEMHHIVQNADHSARRRNGNSSAAEGQLERTGTEALKGSHPLPFGTPQPTVDASTPLHEVRGVRGALHDSPFASGAQADLALTAVAIFLFVGAMGLLCRSRRRHRPQSLDARPHTQAMVGPRVDTTSATVAHCKSLERLGDATLPGGSDSAIVLQHAKLEALRFSLEAKDAKARAAQLASELELSRQQAEDELSATVAKMQAQIRDSVAQRADMQRRWNAILATERLGKDEVSQLEEKSKQAMEERDAAAALVEEEIRQRMEAEEAREEALNEVAALREALQTAEEAMRGVEKQLADETRLRYVAEAAANAAQADAARATERSQEEKARAQVAVDAVVATDEEIRVAREQAEAIATEAAKTVLRAAEARVTAAKDEAANMLRAAKEECTGKVASAARRLATLEAELASTKQAVECEVRAARQQVAAAEAGRKEAEAQAEASAAAAKEASLRQLLEQRAHMLELQMLRQAAHEEMATAELVAKAALCRGERVVSKGEGRAADVANETAPPPHSPGASSLACHSPTHPRFAQTTPSPHGHLARRIEEDEAQLALPARRSPLAPHARTITAEEQPPLAPLEGAIEEEENFPLASPAGRTAKEGEAPLAAPGRRTTHAEAAPCKAGEAATQRSRAEAKVKLEHLLAHAGAETHASPVRTAISHFSLSSLGPPAESIAPHGSHRGAGATWCPSPSVSGSAASNSENGDDGSLGGLDENQAAAAANLLPLLHYPINKPAGKGAGLAFSNSRRAAGGEREGSQLPAKAASAQPRGPACSDRANSAIRGSEVEAGGTQTHDDRLWHAFMAADTDGSGAISKRELYRALDAVGLYASPSEQLAIWKMFDRNSKGKVEWGEFSTIGRALLRTSSAAALSGAQPRRAPSGPHPPLPQPGAFTRRPLEEERSLQEAASQIQSLARKRSSRRLTALRAQLSSKR